MNIYISRISVVIIGGLIMALFFFTIYQNVQKSKNILDPTIKEDVPKIIYSAPDDANKETIK